MLTVVPVVVGESAAGSWQYLLRGLWESGLRLGELLDVHWTDPQYLVPNWGTGMYPVLSIPHERQKNATEESIPLLPGFEAVLQETPSENRSGFVFEPESLQTKAGRKPGDERLRVEWIDKVVTRIGEKAGVVVVPEKNDKPAKFASAHDLRRSCADRLVEAGVSERDVASVMRHASVETTRRHYAPGTVQRSAATIRDRLSIQIAVTS